MDSMDGVDGMDGRVCSIFVHGERRAFCPGAVRVIRTHLPHLNEHGLLEDMPYWVFVDWADVDKRGECTALNAIFYGALEAVERWGERMVQRGLTSTSEEWYTNGSWRSGDWQGFHRTLSHAWSAGPAEFLIRNLIGFEIAAPGCGQVRLRPKRTDFDWEVFCPLPQGDLRVAWSKGRHAVRAPKGVTVV